MKDDQIPASSDLQDIDSSVIGSPRDDGGGLFGEDSICEPLSAREERQIDVDSVSENSFKKSSSTGRLPSLDKPLDSLDVDVDAYPSEKDVSTPLYVHRGTQASQWGHHGVPVLEHLEETTPCSTASKVERRMALTARESPKRTMSTMLEHASTFHGIVEDMGEKKRRG